MAVIEITRRQTLKFLVFGMFATWVVSLAGLIHTANLCRRKELHYTHPTFIIGHNDARSAIIDGYTQPFPRGAADDLPYPDGSQLAYRCGIHFSLEFWAVMFEFFIIVFSWLAVTRPNMFNSKYTLSAFIGIATYQYMYYASIFTKLSYAFNEHAAHPDKAAHSTTTAMAGAIMVLVMNYIFLWFYTSEWGIEDDLAEEAADQDAKSKDILNKAGEDQE
ncbi:hypothetical protein DUNSADRAFT_7597 [Dunaliella salina]|uniref:MARVEL domain-containing protein n=1 Tax=Dunaliella salina TaxID=3046 RepID=A0ABQ7GL44_DUNSA|nr:hypothetical protein DUNSADRAFT_7597 [Dunaliella salina]|eukprot:KAF5835317.1 hypothetical protein DUNSADRAFT_7597 [Dunaliella salina]